MAKIATQYDIKGDDETLRKDIFAIKNELNRINNGVSGTFTTVDGKTVTVENGQITLIV
jgi:hypothetical protein